MSLVCSSDSLSRMVAGLAWVSVRRCPAICNGLIRATEEGGLIIMETQEGRGCVIMACTFWLVFFLVLGVSVVARRWNVSPRMLSSLVVVGWQISFYLWMCVSQEFKYKRRSASACGASCVSCVLVAAAWIKGYEALWTCGVVLSAFSILIVWPDIRIYLLREHVTQLVSKGKPAEDSKCETSETRGGQIGGGK